MSVDTPIRLVPPAREQGFRHYPDPAGSDRVMIVPTRKKFSWKPEERPFRSVILNADGTVASSGFPKFGNVGEYGFDDHTEALWEAVRSGGEVVFTDKSDGSLIIRSVIDGQVMIRTRGGWDGGIHGAAVRKLAQERYPRLLDPAFEPDRSLLFEFVSPKAQFKVILTYERDDLILLGAISHHDLRLAGWPDLEQLSEQTGVKLVPRYTLPMNRKKLIAEVAGWSDREGIVARVADGQTLVKLKSKRYLTMHRIRFLLSATAIRELCDDKQIKSVEEFNRVLAGDVEAYDWEVLKETEPYVQAYLDTVSAADRRLAELDVHALELAMQHPGDRKSIALKVTSQFPVAERGPLFLLLDGREGEAEQALRKVMLNEVFERLANAEPALPEPA